MVIVDILGREVKVGDIVVSTNNSSSWKQIHVVTRLGSKDRVQVNGCSYVMAEYMMVCTEQYIIAKGEAEANKLIDQYREDFKEEQVKKKLPSPKFWILKFSKYNDRNMKPRCFVVKLQGNGDECNKQYKEFISKFDLSELGGLYANRESLNAKNLWVYASMNDAKTMKELKVLGLEEFIDQEIPFDHSAYQNMIHIR